MQTRLEPLKINRERKNYEQINYIDKQGVQHIELNRGCKRQCPFCHADPNFKTFKIPEILSNKVQIIGEGILYDPDIWNKFICLKNIKVNKKVVYYGLSQGIDYRLLNLELINAMSSGRIGLITHRGKWKKGMRIAWDWGLEQEKDIRRIIDLLIKGRYRLKEIIIFVLVNWKIPLEVCKQKLMKLKEWGVMIDDCTWECTKKNFIPLKWTEREYREFRAMCRDHNIRIPRGGYNPEKAG